MASGTDGGKGGAASSPLPIEARGQAIGAGLDEPATSPWERGDPQDDDVAAMVATAGLTGDQHRPLPAPSGVVGRVASLEAQADAHHAALASHFEQFTARLDATNTSSMEVVGLLAGQVVARVDDIAAGLEAALTARHEALTTEVEATLSMYFDEMIAKCVAAQATTAELVTRLLAEQSGHPPAEAASES